MTIILVLDSLIWYTSDLMEVARAPYRSFYSINGRSIILNEKRLLNTFKFVCLFVCLFVFRMMATGGLVRVTRAF